MSENSERGQRKETNATVSSIAQVTLLCQTLRLKDSGWEPLPEAPATGLAPPLSAPSSPGLVPSFLPFKLSRRKKQKRVLTNLRKSVANGTRRGSSRADRLRPGRMWGACGLRRGPGPPLAPHAGFPSRFKFPREEHVTGHQGRARSRK